MQTDWVCRRLAQERCKVPGRLGEAQSVRGAAVPGGGGSHLGGARGVDVLHAKPRSRVGYFFFRDVVFLELCVSQAHVSKQIAFSGELLLAGSSTINQTRVSSQYPALPCSDTRAQQLMQQGFVLDADNAQRVGTLCWCGWFGTSVRASARDGAMGSWAGHCQQVRAELPGERAAHGRRGLGGARPRPCARSDCLVASRQGVPHPHRCEASEARVARGALKTEVALHLPGK